MKLRALIIFLIFITLGSQLHADGLRIKSISLSDSELASDIEDFDTAQNPDCDPNSTTLEPETFGTIRFKLKVQNDYLENISIKRYQIRVGGLYRSRRYAPTTISLIEPGTSDDSVGGYLALVSGGRKRFIGDDSDIPNVSAARRITIILYAVSSSGRRYTISASVTRAFGDIDNC